MLVLGIAVDGSRSVARCIVVQSGDPLGQVIEKRELSYEGADQPTCLYDMSKAFRTFLKEKNIGCVVIKQADPSRNPPRAASLNRLMAEGALAAAAPATVPATLLLPGSQCARLLDVSKEDAVLAAKEAARSQGFTQAWADAIFAARAAGTHSSAA
jgi:hypothetical protein